MNAVKSSRLYGGLPDKDCAVILRIVAESIDPATMRRVTVASQQGYCNQTLIAE